MATLKQGGWSRQVRIVGLIVFALALLTALGGCAWIQNWLNPNHSPVAVISANPTSGEAPLEVTFDASQSYDPDGSLTSYAWSFGDGGSASGVTTSHTYTSAGTYMAQLTVTDDDGSTDFATRTIQVSAAPVPNTPPTAGFTATPTSGEAPLTVNFDASASSDPDGSIVSYVWSFGDGESGSGLTATHTYTSAGTYSVQLTVTDNDGATDSYRIDIAVAIQGTEVGGILALDTTWTEKNSPYVVTDTVQIPSGVTLTIEPGVIVVMPQGGDMFLLNGTIHAHGTPSKQITFDGAGNSNFFSAKNSDADTFLDLEYCIIHDGQSFWPATGYEQYGVFSLRHCELRNLTDRTAYIWYPDGDVYIEYNKFTNTGGISVGHSGNITVYIRYNLFDGRNPSLPHYADY